VDAVEVVHGRWIEKEYVDEPYGGYYLFHCSECGIPNARERNYCPNCGAKMDGDGNG
jgi:rubrerythrin